ncbi:MAG: hypothetical protein ACP5RW_09360 [bacterium]
MLYMDSENKVNVLRDILLKARLEMERANLTEKEAIEMLKEKLKDF